MAIINPLGAPAPNDCAGPLLAMVSLLLAMISVLLLCLNIALTEKRGNAAETAPERAAPAKVCYLPANTPGAFAASYQLPAGVFHKTLCRWDGGF